MADQIQDRSGSSSVPQKLGENTDNCDEMEEDENADEDIEEDPVVLQCKNCNSIVGDSTSWVCANDDLKTVTLHSINHTVTTGKKLMTSTTEGIDLGSTYVHLLCKQCNEVVGRVYKTTSRQLDNLRDLYTFSVHQITSYQIGSREQTAEVDLQDMLDLHSTKSLKQSILKTQVMICALNNRIRNIENSLEIEEIPDEEQAPEGGSHVPIKAPSDLHKGASRGEGSKQQTSLQDKVTSQHIDSGSGAVQNGRQYTTGKRSKELPATAGSKGSKRSRFK